MNSKAKEFLARARRAVDKVVDPDALGITALEALADSLQGHKDEALKRLEGKTDPQSIRSRLTILFRLERFEEAAKTIRNLSPDPRWCDLAVAALVSVDDQSGASKLIKWAESQANLELRRKCLLMYADAAFGRAGRMRKADIPFVPGKINQAERASLENALDSLRPLVQSIIGNSRIESQLDEISAVLWIKAAYLVQSKEMVSPLVPLLLNRRPLPLELGKLVLGRAIEPPEGIVTRLREDYPEMLEAQVVASLIESDRFRQHDSAFDAIFKLGDLAKTPQDHERLFFALFEIGQSAAADRREKLAESVPRLLQHDKRLAALAQAGLALRSGDLSAADSALTLSKDESDPRWLQLRSSFLLQSGDSEGAIAALRDAARRFPHPDIHRQIAELAYRQAKPAEATAALEELLSVDPENLAARRNLAAIYAEVGEFGKAAEHFEHLCKRVPENSTYRLNHAICLAKSNRLNESLESYDKLCLLKDPPLEALAGRVEVLKALGRPDDAFRSLAPHRDRFWNEPKFLLSYMDVAYAAGEEAAAHEAFQKLHHLRAEGRVSEELMQEWSMDEVLHLVGQERERHEEVHKDLLKGKMSWVLIDTAMKRSVYWGWRLRTYPLAWVGDDPVNRAEYSIYATNGFHPLIDSGGNKYLLNIECPPAGQVAVADISALITLHRLGLLERAAEYFGKIFIPSAYLSYALSEASKLVLHQRSQRTAAEQVLDAVQTGRIKLKQGETDEEIPMVDEHTTPEEDKKSQPYRLKDIATGLQGRVPHSQIEGLLRIAAQPARSNTNHPPLAAGAAVRIALSTLETLTIRGLLEPVLEIYRVQVSAQDRDEAMSRVRALRLREEVRGWQGDLWRRIREDARFVQTAHPPLPGEKVHETDDRDVAFAALLLARERQVPLIVDDRMLQAAYLNEHLDQPHAAFGTDALMAQLRSSGAMDAEKYSDHFMDLVRWRYRFLVPPPEVIKVLADRFKPNLPGKDLIDLAMYSQDCARDPGLFAGPEPVEPPIPMAFKMYQSWVGSIADFIIDLWQDKAYDEATATPLTIWSLTQLLPAVPTQLDYHLQTNAVAVTARFLIGRALIRSTTSASRSRANAAVRAMVKCLGLDAREYSRIVTGVIDAAEIE